MKPKDSSPAISVGKTMLRIFDALGPEFNTLIRGRKCNCAILPHGEGEKLMVFDIAGFVVGIIYFDKEGRLSADSHIDCYMAELNPPVKA